MPNYCGGRYAVKYHVDSTYLHGKEPLFFLSVFTKITLTSVTLLAEHLVLDDGQPWSHEADAHAACPSPFARTIWSCMHQLDKFVLTLSGRNSKVFLKGSLCRRFCTFNGEHVVAFLTGSIPKHLMKCKQMMRIKKRKENI